MTFEVNADAGEARFSYSPASFFGGAAVYVYNRRTGSGVIDTARPDGSVGPTLPFPAALGDSVIVSFAKEEQTVSTCIVVRQGRQSQSDICR